MFQGKSLAIMILIFGIVSVVITSLVAPSVIHFLFTPPVSFGVNCEPAVDWALTRFRQTQLLGFVGGLLVGILVSIQFKRRNATKPSPNDLS